MTKEENKHAIITLKTEWVDMDKLVLTNEKGDTYTTKSEELMDFILSSESENERLKAEELKSKIRYAIATSIYSDPTSLGFKGYDNATEKCLKIIEDYARIQIEKDRERIKKDMPDVVKAMINAVPINLD